MLFCHSRTLRLKLSALCLHARLLEKDTEEMTKCEIVKLPAVHVQHLPVDCKGSVVCVLSQQLRQRAHGVISDHKKLIHIYKCYPLMPRSACMKSVRPV